MAIQNWKALLGGANGLDSELSSFQFSGTTTSVEVPINKLKWVLGADFTLVPGTAGLVNAEQLYIREEAQGTAGTGPAADFYGAVEVSGTSITVDRLVPDTAGTVEGTGVTDLWVLANFVGVGK